MLWALLVFFSLNFGMPLLPTTKLDPFLPFLCQRYLGSARSSSYFCKTVAELRSFEKQQYLPHYHHHSHYLLTLKDVSAGTFSRFPRSLKTNNFNKGLKASLDISVS